MKNSRAPFQRPKGRLSADPLRSRIGWPRCCSGGFLLINPFPRRAGPAYFSGLAPAWVTAVFPWILAFNVLSFWFPLGFTYEVLRRARTGRGVQLPDWEWGRLGVFAKEGAVKLTLAHLHAYAARRRSGWASATRFLSPASACPWRCSRFSSRRSCSSSFLFAAWRAAAGSTAPRCSIARLIMAENSGSSAKAAPIT